MRLLRILLPLLLFLPAASPHAGAQRTAAVDTATVPFASGGDDEIQVLLMTMGPGDAIWEKFGHNAIWIRDPRTGMDVAYNWGVFDFAAADFLPRFLRGDMRYWMEAYPAGPMADHYAASNRSVWVQELALTPAQKRELVTFLEWNARPENRFYRYDYFLDNCSTRVRDALDRVLGGRIRAATDTVPTGTSYRSHTRRLSEEELPMRVGMDVVLGGRGDRPISAWEESFLPMQLREHLRLVQVEAPDGTMRPLVAAERQLFAATRPPEAERPADLTIPFLVAGIVGALMLAALATAGSTRAGARTGFVVTAIVWSVAAGMVGLIMVLTWTATDHVFMYRNENLLQLSPLSLALVPFLPALRVRGPRAGRAWKLAATVAGLSLLGFALQLLPGLDQVNGETIALVLPVHLAVAWRAWRMA